MFRRPSGGTGVSFTRFINNAMPSMMFDSAKDPGHISMPQKDMFYGHQIMSPNPYTFDDRSLLQSGILDSESISKKAFKKLQRSGVLDTEGYVDTMKIGPKFTHDMAVISAVRQKQVIDLLFWWEEECHRLRKLQGEQAELVALVESARVDTAENGSQDGRKEHLDMMTLLLDRVNLKIRQRPSERRQDMEGDEDEVMIRYRTGSVDTTAANTADKLPAYTAGARHY